MRRLRDPDTLLFAVLLALHVVPLWAFRWFPSQDGPAHLENAAILRDYHKPDRPRLREFYTLSDNFDPNWFGHLALAGLMAFLPPLAAEKMLLTGYVVLLPLAARYALAGVRPGAGWLAVLTFPFVGNFLFHMGFHNFCYSLAVFFLVAGYWLRHANCFGARQTLALAVLVLLLYFCHLVAVVMALMLVGTLAAAWALLDFRERRRLGKGEPGAVLRQRLLGPTLAFVPAFALGLAFVGRQGGGMAREFTPAALLEQLVRLEVLVSYFPREGEGLVALLTFAGLAVLTVAVLFARWRARLLERRDLLLAVVALTVVAYLVAPSALSGGSFLNDRLSLFVVFFLILWLGAHPFAPGLKRGVQVVATLVTLALLGLHAWAYAEFNRYLEDYATVESHLEPGATVLPLTFTHGLRSGKLASAKVGVFRHAAGYLAARRGVIELENYEANTGYFPVRYRPELNPFDKIGRENAPDRGLQAEPPDIKSLSYPEGTGQRVDFVLLSLVTPQTRSEPASELIFAQLAKDYILLYESPRGRFRLYLHKDLTADWEW